jgi:FkbM family methyltransferase
MKKHLRGSDVIAGAALKKKRKVEQFEFLDHVLKSGWIKEFSVAIDGGANIGTWAIRMAERFNLVLAFEPAPEIFAVMQENIAPFPKIIPWRMALLDKATKVKMVQPDGRSTKRSQYVQESKVGTITATTIDELGMANCGFIKLDLEGAEYPALLGGEATIMRFRPTVMIEVSKGYAARFGAHGDAAPHLLSKWGYRMVGECWPDQVWIAP